MDFEETKSYEYKVKVTLRSSQPVAGCEINPSVSVNGSKGSLPVQSDIYSMIKFRWYRYGKLKICSIHQDRLATVHCVSCVKLNISIKESYHCSRECFQNSWKAHSQRHLEAERRTLDDDKQMGRKLRSCGSWAELGSECLIDQTAALVEEERKDCLLVNCSKTYEPKLDDIGFILKLECVAVDSSTNVALSELNVTVTDPVIAFPVAQPRCMVQIGHPHESSSLCSTSFNGITFSILSYNILSDVLTYGKYYYCPTWALVWEYRRCNLLCEIIEYNADIICLQEVQSNHFVSFFEPELRKKGYAGIYKEQGNRVCIGSQHVACGCATFYRYDLFKEVAIYEVEFNKKISSVVEALKPELRNEASIRLGKYNVALIIILETLENCDTYDAFRSRICVVNVHICSDPAIPDVKLFQVVTLIHELEQILQSEIPLLICGDFNSIPQSDPHTFMVTGRLEHIDSVDPYGLYQHLKLDHRFSLASAYASFGQAATIQERQLRKFNPETKEPILTCLSQRVPRTLDYIFYTGNSLKVEGLLELLDRKDVGVAKGLPSSLWSSDHIALMASFKILPSYHSASMTERAVTFSLLPGSYWNFF